MEYILGLLSEREQRLLDLRYRQGMTQEECGRFTTTKVEKHKTKMTKNIKQRLRKTQNNRIMTSDGSGKVKYIERIIDRQIDQRIKAFNAISIVGPKDCGKTRTAKERALFCKKTN